MSTNPHCPTSGPHTVPADPFASPVIAGGMFTFTPVGGLQASIASMGPGTVRATRFAPALQELQADGTWRDLPPGEPTAGQMLARFYADYPDAAVNFPREGANEREQRKAASLAEPSDEVYQATAAKGGPVPAGHNRRGEPVTCFPREGSGSQTAYATPPPAVEPTLLERLEKRLHAVIETRYVAKAQAMRLALQLAVDPVKSNPLGRTNHQAVEALVDANRPRLLTEAEDEILAALVAAAAAMQEP